MNEQTIRMIHRLDEVLAHERSHFEFYQHAGFIIKGLERTYLKPLLDKEMAGELEHVRLFAEKIVALGGIPMTKAKDWFITMSFTKPVSARDILEGAVSMERQVLGVYHDLYPEAEKFADVFGDKSIVLLLEENIEHTTRDVEEMEKILAGMPLKED